MTITRYTSPANRALSVCMGIASGVITLALIVPDSPSIYKEGLAENGEQAKTVIRSDASIFNSASRVSSVPIIRRVYGVPVVRVQLNSIYTVEMLVDSGAGKSLITTETLDLLGLRLTGTQQATIADGSVVTMGLATLDTLSANQLEAHHIEVLVSNSKIGLLGQDILNQYDVLIKEQTVEFHRR